MFLHNCSGKHVQQSRLHGLDVRTYRLWRSKRPRDPRPARSATGGRGGGGGAEAPADLDQQVRQHGAGPHLALTVLNVH